MDQIITDRPDVFKYIDSQEEISQFYKQNVVDHKFWLLSISHPLAPCLQTKQPISIENIECIVEECKQKSEVSNVTSRLKTNPLEVNKHIVFAEEYGGEDWGNYYIRFCKLIEKWDLYEQILHYCWERANQNDSNYYHKFMNLWNSLNRLSDLCGYWDKRIFWLRKSIIISEQNQEWEDYVRALTRLAWTFTMQYELDEAKKQLDLIHLKLHSIKSQSIVFRFAIVNSFLIFATMIFLVQKIH